jgi:hypothetical protein
MKEAVEEYETRLRERVGEGEFERHRELVRLLARNLALEDVLWGEITTYIRDLELRNELLKQRNQIVKDIHTEFRALKIEVPTLVEKKTEKFMGLLGDLDEIGEERGEGIESSPNGA